eukprot:13690585-Alexandrium_andersonii.AAC.1
MSASLVGSEMCIRDSTIGLSARNDAEPPGPGLAGWNFKLFPASTPDYGCLLYTSDAADDM